MDEFDLLMKLYHGDADAYKQLFVRYYSPLVEYASQFLPDEDAEELVQELMLYIWESREELIIETSLKSYLFTAVRFRCLNAIKKRLYHERIHNLIYEKIKDRFDDPDYYLANELAEYIRKAIGELPETYRETFVLSRFGERTNVEIAEKLAVSVKTVEYRIKQSLKILRIKLEDYLH
ncbi:MAG: RNA polymerase sigma-70 factor [Tannerellaceae bacterium]|jgi:RNA polymerase sigma-70 factor (ECF subfamily)|nr:RNA polymerase sigma-70 factor [Tannerellaceae bacterium]